MLYNIAIAKYIKSNKIIMLTKQKNNQCRKNVSQNKSHNLFACFFIVSVLI